uniref:Protein krueppel n=1 Tax=Anopheles culicifacies TaxID=139723 RepID=A0A182M0V0_9DIPT
MNLYQETTLTESAASDPFLDWNDMCRTCLQPGVSRSIFDVDESMQLTYAEKVMQCVNVTIREADNLPNRICSQCIEDLAVAYRFQLNCLEAIALLQGSGTFECLEEKQPDLSPIVMPVEESGPEDEDGIAIHLDSGVTYTYKPPAGLNVKLTHTVLERDKNIASKGNNTVADETANADEEGVTFEPVAKNEPLSDASVTAQVSENDEIEYLIYMKGGSDTEMEMPTIADNTKEPNLKTETEQMVNNTPVSYNQNHSIRVTDVKTLQTIRKSNQPNELKPTIEMVTSQPATDGTGVETVIRIKRNLAGPKPSFLCKICNVTYKHKHALETHMRRHRGERPHKCEYCEKSFVVAFELQRHVRIHTGQKPYKCQYCDRAYSDFGSKTKHERTHTGERPYACDLCGKTFSYSHVLSSHRLIHTGVKKYGCTICGKRFSKSHHLKSHYNTHRPQKVIVPVAAKNEAANELPAERDNTKQDTKTVVYSELLQDELIASKGDEITVLGQQQSNDVVFVDSYTDTGAAGLLTPSWPLVDGEKGDGCANVNTEPSVVTIAPEELESVAIVNFGDYMMKTTGLEGFVVEDSGDGDPLVGRQFMGR